jgi:hypothetical protein
MVGAEDGGERAAEITISSFCWRLMNVVAQFAESFRLILEVVCNGRLKIIPDSTRLCFIRVHNFYMAIRISKAAREDHWLARAGFGLFVAGLAAWLVALYWAAPLDF